MDKTVLHDISYGMYIISTKYNNKNVGCVINTFSQITSNDMIVIASLNKQNYTNEAIKSTKKFALSIISEETNSELIGTFGFQSSKNINKFANFNYKIAQNLPIINENCTGYLICELINIIDAGTHDIMLAKVIDAVKENNNTPMTYSYYHQVIKGKAPKSAPTYIEESDADAKKISNAKKYKCLLCGYIYDDSKESTKFEDLPSDWKCPICGVDKSMFQEIK